MADPTSLSETVAATLTDRIRALELEMLALLAHNLKQGLELNDWATAKLEAISDFYRQAQHTIGPWAVEWADAIDQAVMDAVANGLYAADMDLSRVTPLKQLSTTSLARMLAIATEETVYWKSIMLGYPGRILRDVDDAYRLIVSEQVTGAVLGVETRRQATQRIINRLADQGITRFVAKNGAVWRADTYAEMAARTALGNSAMTAAINRYRDMGAEVLQVTDAPDECPKCAPWEKQLLAINGPSGDRYIEDMTGKPVLVHIKGTYEEAIAQGFQHPNCRHSVTLYMPGYTPVGNAEHSPETYEASQQQRYQERQVRKWKRREAAALDDDTANTAHSKVRSWQAAIRDTLSEYPELRRKREREHTPFPH